MNLFALIYGLLYVLCTTFYTGAVSNKNGSCDILVLLFITETAVL